MDHNIQDRLREESRMLRREVRQRTFGYIIAALGLVAGLAWNQAITALIDKFFHTANGILAKFLYAALVTLLVVILSIYLARLQDGGENK